MIQINGKPINVTQFPDNTHLFKCVDFQNTPSARLLYDCDAAITWKYDNDAEIFQLQCVVDYLRSNGFTKLKLHMPYVPNARMDRTQNNEMFTLKSFAKLINNMRFHKVIVLDIHSHVGEALIENIVVQSPKPCIQRVINEYLPNEPLTLFFPDEGAMKRYHNIAVDLQHDFVFGMKNRDWATGNIKGLQTIGDKRFIENHNILIVDDICSKGGTFYHSAKALKEQGAKNIYLYVSHLENAVHQGEMISSGLISHIYTTDSIYRPELAPAQTKTPIDTVNR